MCSSRKYPYPPQGRLTEIPRGRGFQEPNFLKENMALKWDFQRVWGQGFMLKTFHGRGMSIFWNNTFITKNICTSKSFGCFFSS